MVCGLFEEPCLCPECPECGSIGDPQCYVRDDELPALRIHFCRPHLPIVLKRSPEQIASKARIEAQLEEDAAAEALYEEAEALFDDFGFSTEQTTAMHPVERECWARIGYAMPRALRYSAQWERW